MATFGDAMKEAGLTDDQRTSLLAIMRREYMTVSHDWRREEQERKERREAEKKAAADAALPYRGAIEYCQASVHEQGRGVGFHQCSKKARFVIRVEDDRQGDGRLAVCRTHTKPGAYRFIKHWKYEVSATDPVESEYQPE